jgi:hypothetical protein
MDFIFSLIFFVCVLDNILFLCLMIFFVGFVWILDNFFWWVLFETKMYQKRSEFIQKKKKEVFIYVLFCSVCMDFLQLFR